ncbi:MAG: isoprenyl transferase [Bacteroidaceae bacterium]|nr:isoprenyl transferase [Bacteroidaceae bacterium]MBR6893604.1 isoprenyl transferase [Bacteroidaceae bacterium]
MSVQLDRNRIPRHIAIIMDGNGRWAKARGQERTVGHQQGAQQVHEIMEEAVRLGVDYLTLYTFSTENWNRPKEEITALMALLLQHLDEDTFMKNNARFKVIGDVHRLSQIVQDAVAHLEEITKNNTNTCMVVALSYSSKWELTKAMKDIAAEVEQGKLKSTDITEETINQHLETKGMPEPELMIRTGGELRLSNYLLWQCAYSEFYFTDVYWPDFTIEEFHKAIADYQGRQRRYGKTGDQIVEETNK